MNGEITTLPNGLEAIEINGVLRMLSKLPPDPTKRQAAPRFTTILPQSEWRETNRRAAFGDEFVLDQQTHGSCTGYGSAGALMKARALMGMAFAKLSGSFIYSKVNGGQDNGAAIHDTLAALEQGTCLDSEAPWDAIYPQQIPASASATAQRFRAKAAEVIDSWEAFISALILGRPCPTAVMVGRSFANVDADGIAGLDRGPGNHCVHFFDVFKTSRGEWAAWGANSWNTSFGKRGYFGITQRHFEGVQQDCYQIEVVAEDPQEPNAAPAVVMP